MGNVLSIKPIMGILTMKLIEAYNESNQSLPSLPHTHTHTLTPAYAQRQRACERESSQCVSEAEVRYFAEVLTGRNLCSDLATKRYDKGSQISSADSLATMQ